VAVDYLGERTQFSPEQLMAMLMVDEKGIAETDGSPVSDCVIAIPAYFSMEERRAMLDASQIAGINCLRLMPETTATALAYGIYKTDLPEKDPVNVVFVDVGYSCLQVPLLPFPQTPPTPTPSTPLFTCLHILHVLDR
jgi:heat shock protein 4